MTVALKPGARLFSTACSAELIAVKAPPGDVELTIGGVPPALDASDRDAPSGVAAGHEGGVILGKRYVDDENTIELLCTKAGDGLPAVDGRLLVLKESKPLPSSD
jgi:hypothetical protein